MGLTFADLLQLRARGQRPALPVVLARTRVGRAMWDELPVIQIDDRPALELLTGLRVWSFLGCAGTRDLVRQMRERDVWCRELLSWCERDKTLAKFYGTCTCAT